MNFKITEESKQIALRAAIRPGENVHAAAYGTYTELSFVDRFLFSYAYSVKNVYAILTDTMLKIVVMNSLDMNKVNDIYEIPYNELQNAKCKKGILGVRNIKFKCNKMKYKLVIFNNAGKHILYQKENAKIFEDFFTNMHNIQKSRK